MEFRFIILTFPVIFLMLLSEAKSADLVDFIPAIIGPTKKDLMTCFQCTNTTDSRCNSIPNNSTTFSMECEEGAKGCVKKLYDVDGFTVMSRECYYGPTKIYQDFSCKGTKSHYPREKCYVCNSNLCNSSSRFFALSNMFLVVILTTTVGLLVLTA